MSYSLATLWYERQRYLPGILATAFSALLIVVQCGLLLGLFAIVSIPIDHSSADVWVGSPQVLSVDLGRPMPERYLHRVAVQPEVERCEVFLEGFMHWTKPNGGSELCIVIGMRLGDDALGAPRELTPALRAKLAEPGAVIVDEGELARLGMGSSAVAEITNRACASSGRCGCSRRPYVFVPCRRAGPERMSPEQTTYVRALPECCRLLRWSACEPMHDVRVYQQDFSVRSRLHWLTKTKAESRWGCGGWLLVGAVDQPNAVCRDRRVARVCRIAHCAASAWEWRSCRSHSGWEQRSPAPVVLRGEAARRRGPGVAAVLVIRRGCDYLHGAVSGLQPASLRLTEPGAIALNVDVTDVCARLQAQFGCRYYETCYGKITADVDVAPLLQRETCTEPAVRAS